MGGKNILSVSKGFWQQWLFWIVVAMVLFAPMGQVDAASTASLGFAPAVVEKQVGESFSVSVIVSSPDQSMNAASATVAFPADILEVISVSKTGSIVNFWVQEPSFSNQKGTIQFEGLVLNPGYKGSSGTLAIIQFWAKSAGNATLSFSSGAVLANDGRGSNILSSLDTARVSIGMGVVVPVTENGSVTSPATTAAAVSTPSIGLPSAPQVISTTHPDQNAWYADANPMLHWSVPAGITGVNVTLDHNSKGGPGVRLQEIISGKKYDSVKDGKWYFHARLANAQGWSAVSHFRIQIDTTPPDPFLIQIPAGQETNNPQPVILFSTKDALSGVESYTIKIGERTPIAVTPEEIANGAPYVLPVLEPGNYTIVAQAFDRAGNSTTSTAEVTIMPLDPPAIVSYPRELAAGEALKIQGTTYANATVNFRVTSERGGVEFSEIKSDMNGGFEFIWPRRIKSGLYAISAQAIDARGARSNFSEPITIEVRLRSMLRIGSIVLDYLVVVVSLLAILIALMTLIMYAWRCMRSLRRRLRKEVREAEEAVHVTFDTIREEFQTQLRKIEKVVNSRKCTMEEEKLLCQLREMLNSAESLISKELMDVERVVDAPAERKKRGNTVFPPSAS